MGVSRRMRSSLACCIGQVVNVLRSTSLRSHGLQLFRRGGAGGCSWGKLSSHAFLLADFMPVVKKPCACVGCSRLVTTAKDERQGRRLSKKKKKPPPDPQTLCVHVGGGAYTNQVILHSFYASLGTMLSAETLCVHIKVGGGPALLWWLTWVYAFISVRL